MKIPPSWPSRRDRRPDPECVRQRQLQHDRRSSPQAGVAAAVPLRPARRQHLARPRARRRAGQTVYLLTADGHDHSTCSSSCLQFWPRRHARRRRQASVTSRRDRHAGRHRDRDRRRAPGLHVLRRTSSPGTSTARASQEFGGTWYAVSPTGQPVTGTAGVAVERVVELVAGRGVAY